MSETKEPRPRITSWIRENFGEEILNEIKAGKRKISLNGVKLDASLVNFRDKRVNKFSQIEIKPEPKSIPKEIQKFEKEFKKIKVTTKGGVPTKELIDLYKKTSEETVNKEKLIKKSPKLDIVKGEKGKGMAITPKKIEKKAPCMIVGCKDFAIQINTSTFSSGMYCEKHFDEINKKPKIYIKDFLSANDIVSVTSKKSNVYIDGLVTTLDTEVEVDDDTNPLRDGKIATIKVLSAFRGG